MSATKVLLGYSESHGAERVVEEAIKRTRGRDAFVHVVTSMLGHGELPGAGGEEAGGAPGCGPDQERCVLDIEAAERSLARVKEELTRAGVACETHLLVHGQTPGQDLVEFATRHRVDEIILGARRHSLLGEVLAGSTERHVTTQAPCPVVLVHLD
jgi:nucleotide-binding universal stress UspA family protein